MFGNGGIRPGEAEQRRAGSGFQGDSVPLGAGEEWLGTPCGEGS